MAFQVKTTVLLLFCCCSAQAQLDSTRSALLKLMQQLNRKAEHGRNGVKKGDAESGDRNTWDSCKKKIAACQRSDPTGIVPKSARRWMVRCCPA